MRPFNVTGRRRSVAGGAANNSTFARCFSPEAGDSRPRWTSAFHGTRNHIPTSHDLPLASLTPDFTAHNDRIILYSGDGTEAAQAWFLLEAQGFKDVYLLDGGLRAWQNNVLFPQKSAGTDPAVFDKQVEVAKYFGGAPQEEGTSPAARVAVALPKLAAPAQPPIPAGNSSNAQPKKKKEGC